MSQCGSGTRSLWGPNPGVGRVTRAPEGRVLGEESPCALGNTGRWGINYGAGAHALLGCDRNWVPATESSARARGKRERGRVPRARLSGMPAPTCSFLGGRVDRLRDGTEEATLRGRSIKERSENFVPPLLLLSSWSVCHCLT